MYLVLHKREFAFLDKRVTGRCRIRFADFSFTHAVIEVTRSTIGGRHHSPPRPICVIRGGGHRRHPARVLPLAFMRRISSPSHGTT
jgi:hypothetical protein